MFFIRDAMKRHEARREETSQVRWGVADKKAMAQESEMTVLLRDAIVLATSAHAGQFDKGGQPYILHPLRVMLAVPSPAARVVAVLHDVLEDVPAYRQNAISLLMPYTGLLLALKGVTKHEYGKESYKDFIKRVRRTSALAIQVKLADITDNSDPTRAYAEGVVGMIADRYVWAAAMLVTGDEVRAASLKREALVGWRERGIHPSRYVAFARTLGSGSAETDRYILKGKEAENGNDNDRSE